MKVLRMSSIFFSLLFVSLSLAQIDPETIEGLWLFDEGSGTVARDSSGKGRDGEIIGGPKWVKGKFGTALEFDGVDDCVVITGYFGIGGSDPRTTVFWWKSSEVRTHSWVKWGIVQNTKKYYIRGHVSGGQVFLRVETQGGQHYGSTNVCDGQWHHLAVVFPKGGKSVKDHLLYVDGVLEKKTAGNPVGVDTDNTTQEVVMGRPLAHHVYAKGVMDEVAIFSVDLTENDIRNIMDQGLSRVALAVNHAGKLTTTWATIKSQ